MKLRRKIKKNLLEKCQDMKKIFYEVNKLLTITNDACLFELLVNFQRRAIELGTSIEHLSVCHEKDKAVVFLEQLCEIIYQLNSSEKDRKLLLEKSGHFIDEIISIINAYETDNRIEAVFLPYKASMWDSLESIFFAALEDPECDAHVVPIPYYEKSEEGNSLELNCDQDLFPENIPVESWKVYNIAERKPDIIFIHNPYDGNNSVTCVKPDYFSIELKKHTDMLVYVPYFLSSEEIPESHIFLPSYQNFDKIIVQNENYKKEMCKFISEEKVAVLGSPKCDRIMSDIKNADIDECWKEKIEGKKVIFFNFSISKLLSESIETYLDKVEYFFDLTKKYQNIIVIWRPHPLLTSTMNSLRKDLKKRILGLKEKFLNECIGIYDTSPNPSAAISVSDVYVGESTSSIMYMFGISGKPVFIMNEYLDEEEIAETGAVHLVSDNKKNNIIYFISNKYSAVCEYDIVSEKCSILFSLSGLSNTFLNGTIRVFENCIYVVLLSEPVLFKYDLISKKLMQTVLPSIENMNDSISGFGDIVKYKEYIYILPVRFPGIIRLNCDLTDMKTVIHFPLKLLPPVQKDDLWFYTTDSTFGEGKLYLTSVFDNSIWECCLDTEELKIHYLGEKNSRYILGWNKDLFLMKRWGSKIIYLWNPENEKMEEKAFLSEDCIYSEEEWKKENKDSCFFADAEDDDFIHIASLKKKQVISINKSTGEKMEWKVAEEGLENIYGIFYLSDKNYIVSTDRRLYLFDEKKKTSYEINLRISKRALKQCRRETKIKCLYVYKENAGLEIEDFLAWISEGKIETGIKENNPFWKMVGYNGQNVGKTCYKFIKKLCFL